MIPLRCCAYVEYIVLFHYLENKMALKLYYFVLYFVLAVYIFNRS